MSKTKQLYDKIFSKYDSLEAHYKMLEEQYYYYNELRRSNNKPSGDSK